MTLILTGTGVSRGIAIGKAHILQRGQPEVTELALPKHLIESEIERFKSAIDAATHQLRAIRKKIPSDTAVDITAFIDTHLLMMEDSTLTEAPVNIIRERQCNAEWAIKIQRDALVAVFDEMDDPYLRTRRDDVDHVIFRIQRILLNQSDQQQDAQENPLKGCIVLADDISPADTVLMQHQGIAGFITEYGGPTSHTAILAHGLGIPAIVGLRHVKRYIKKDEQIIIDGKHGIAIAGADKRTLKFYRDQQKQDKQYWADLDKLQGKPAITRNGCKIKLHANIELPQDIPAIKRLQADGVGLYRTEFLFMNRPDTPSEEEQLKAYARVVKGLKGAPITIRTLDLGADKQVDGGGQNRAVGNNPALGLRAVRLCLKEPSLFMPQLRAILRAAAHGPVQMMIPMLSNINELLQVLEMVDEAKRELGKQRMKFDPDLLIGGMIEIPGAALLADTFAKYLDFLSIGTNDLIQYTLAIDRIDDEVSYLYDPVHPAVLQLIKMTIDAGHKAGIPVAMCGEMAGDTRFTRLLLGMGLKEFSMRPVTLLEVKKIVIDSDTSELQKFARTVLKQGDQKEIRDLIETCNMSSD